MATKSFWIQWLATFVLLIIVELIFDLVTGELGDAFTPSRIFWVVVISLGINLIFYKRNPKNNQKTE